MAIDRHLFPDATKRVRRKTATSNFAVGASATEAKDFPSFETDVKSFATVPEASTSGTVISTMHGEIHFPPELDEYFGIQTNKSRFSVDKELQEVLAEEIATVITQVRKMQAGTADERRAVRAGIMESDAEANVRTLASRLPVPIYTEADLDKGRAFQTACDRNWFQNSKRVTSARSRSWKASEPTF